MNSNPDFIWTRPLTDRSSKGSTEAAFEYNIKLKKKTQKNIKNKEAYYSKAKGNKNRNNSKSILNSHTLDG
jgi:hypothetical protein